MITVLVLIAFGKYAGMVGAHNAIWTYGMRIGTLALPRLHTCRDYAEIKEFYEHTSFPECRIVLTGTGRVANGAARVLDDMGYVKVTPHQYKQSLLLGKVYVQLGVTDYASKKDGGTFEESEFFNHPDRFIIDFSQYYSSADILINGIYWDIKAPAFFTVSEMTKFNFKIKVIADITCDIAPESSIPSTLRATSIADPVFGFDPQNGKETAAYLSTGVDMMTIDNLPNELSRDASEAFGELFIEHVLPEFNKPQSAILERGTITRDGELTEHFKYLHDYVMD